MPDQNAPLRAIRPMTWVGVQKGGPDSPMVCGACPDWQACDRADRCSRASDADYLRVMTEPVNIAHCPEHGLHGARTRCFVCQQLVDQVIPLAVLKGPVHGLIQTIRGMCTERPWTEIDAALVRLDGMVCPVPVCRWCAARWPGVRDGLACVVCGRMDGPMVPAGFGERGQLFRHHECRSTESIRSSASGSHNPEEA